MKERDLILRVLGIRPNRAIEAVMWTDVYEEVSRGHSSLRLATKIEGLNHKQ